MPDARVETFDGQPPTMVTFEYADIERWKVELMARTDPEAQAWLDANPTDGGTP